MVVVRGGVGSGEQASKQATSNNMGEGLWRAGATRMTDGGGSRVNAWLLLSPAAGVDFCLDVGVLASLEVDSRLVKVGYRRQ